MADLDILYEKYGLPGILPNIGSKEDPAYIYFLSKMQDAQEYYYDYSDTTGLPRIYKTNDGYSIHLYLNKRPHTDSTNFIGITCMAESGITEFLIEDTLSIKISEIFEYTPTETEAARILAAIDDGEAFTLSLKDEDVFALVSVQNGKEGLTLIEDSGEEYVTIFLNEYLAIANVDKENDLQFEYCQIPFNEVSEIAEQNNLGIHIDFGRATFPLKASYGLEVSADKEIDDFTPDFLR